MSFVQNRGPLWVGVEELRRGWGWFVGLGLILLLLGLLCLSSAAAAFLVWELILAYSLIAGGVLSLAHAFWRRRWGGFFLEMFSGILYVVVGSMILYNPLTSGIGLGLLIGLALLIGGAFRIAVSLTTPMHHQAWVFLNGVLTLAAGVYLLWLMRYSPPSGMWLIGVFFGVELVFNGWSLVMLGLVARKVSQATAGPEWRDTTSPGVPGTGAGEGIIPPSSGPPAGP
jgi:uncharacterized membrane protein HdeD (DUF308 family)